MYIPPHLRGMVKNLDALKNPILQEMTLGTSGMRLN